MKVMCKICGNTQDKLKVLERVRKDKLGFDVCPCDKCNNKVMFRVTGPKKTILQKGVVVHYK